MSLMKFNIGILYVCTLFKMLCKDHRVAKNAKNNATKPLQAIPPCSKMEYPRHYDTHSPYKTGAPHELFYQISVMKENLAV